MPPPAAGWPRRSAAAIAAALALAPAGCGGGGGGGDGTERTPPDRLAVTLSSEAGPSFRVALDCAVADRPACAEILDALREERDAGGCAPIADTGARIVVRGTIGGDEVGAAIDRRTDCEARLYDRVRAALSP
ncbi:MAG TPA: hypothetical protein VK904_00480 [Miltoncostaeaceae bacterium]|nr:hypothetical protein [Miltoncostaeaceae bacterium]